MGAGRLVTSTVAAAVIAGGITAAPAAAETTTWFNTAPITLTDVTGGVPLPPPSTLQVTGHEGPIADVDLNVNAVDLAHLGELQLVLVSPAGESEVAMSFNCTDMNVTNRIITFDQFAPSSMPDSNTGPCPAPAYKPSNPVGTTELFGGIPGGPPYTNNFDHFDNENANGTWRLYAFKHCGSAACVSTDQIEAGWSLEIETGPIDLDLPAGGASVGAASPYPSTRAIGGGTGLITDLNVRLNGIFHTHPDDIEIMLEKVGGPKVMLMSDACGSFDVNAYGWFWDDEAPATMPNDGTTNICGTTSHRPTDHSPGENLPAPAPAGPYGTSLSAFDLVDPNGEWRLWVADDSSSYEGFFTNKFTLEYTTRPRAATAFTAGSATVAEGGQAALVVRRSGATSYAAASVQVSSATGSAGAGDFAPVSQTLSFAAGQTERTVAIETVDDAATESAETFTVTLSGPSGDAALAAPGTTTVTIPANDAPGGGSGGGGGGGANADATPPETTIDKAPKRKSKKTKARIAFSSSELGSSFECKLDGKPYAPCSSPLRLKRLGRGKHTLRVRARDAAGNVDPTPAKAGWRVVG